VLRALGFVALFQAAGLAIFVAAFAATLATTGPVLRRFGMQMACAAAVLLVAQFALEPVRMAGDWTGIQDESLRSLALQSSLARASAWKLTGLVLALAGLYGRHRQANRLALLGALIALAGFVLTGHTAVHPLRIWLAPLLLLHLVVLAFWFGALLPLWQITRHETAVIAGRIVARFSSRAVILVPVLFVAGVMMAAILLQDAAALQSRYGRLLLAKICLFALLMGLAAMNKWRLGPAIAMGDAGAGRSFRVALAAEAVLIAAALAATAALTLLYSPEH
jgi:putative copper export protein